MGCSSSCATKSAQPPSSTVDHHDCQNLVPPSEPAVVHDVKPTVGTVNEPTLELELALQAEEPEPASVTLLLMSEQSGAALQTVEVVAEPAGTITVLEDKEKDPQMTCSEEVPQKKFVSDDISQQQLQCADISTEVEVRGRSRSRSTFKAAVKELHRKNSSADQVEESTRSLSNVSTRSRSGSISKSRSNSVTESIVPEMIELFLNAVDSMTTSASTKPHVSQFSTAETVASTGNTSNNSFDEIDTENVSPNQLNKNQNFKDPKKPNGEMVKPSLPQERGRSFSRSSYNSDFLDSRRKQSIASADELDPPTRRRSSSNSSTRSSISRSRSNSFTEEMISHVETFLVAVDIATRA